MSSSDQNRVRMSYWDDYTVRWQAHTLLQTTGTGRRGPELGYKQDIIIIVQYKMIKCRAVDQDGNVPPPLTSHIPSQIARDISG